MIDKNFINAHLKRFKEGIKISKDDVQTNFLIENLINVLIGTDFASIWIYDQRKSLFLRYRDYNFITQFSSTNNKGVLHKTFMRQESVICNDLVNEVEYDTEIDNPDKIKIQSKMLLPLIDNARLIGIATVYSSALNPKVFTDYDLNLFKAIAPYIIAGVHKIRKISFSQAKEELYETTINLDKLQTTEEEKERSEAILNNVSSIVHDIRTPANSLYGFLDLLEEKVVDLRLREYIKNAKDSASFINELTSSILDNVANNVEKNDVENSVNTAIFFSKISEIFVSNMYKKNISFNIFIDPLLPKEIHIDTIKLKRVILNLIGNAYKFTPTNRSIEFSVRYKQKDKKIHIFVKDTGIGIEKSKQKEIFKAFEQASEDTKKEFGGHGLGLSICADYIQEMGGELKIESEPNEGSTFYFDIECKSETKGTIFQKINNPEAKICIIMSKKNGFASNNVGRYLLRMGLDKKQIIALSACEKINTSVTHMIVFQNMMSEEIREFCKINKIKLLIVEEELFSVDVNSMNSENFLISEYSYYADTLYSFLDVKLLPRVLIVDDDKISTMLLKSILSVEICQVEVAKNGQEALDILENSIKSRFPFSLIYLDNMMPMLSGDEVVNGLRSLEKEYGVKKSYVVSISGDYIAKKDKNSNYDTYVPKPFDKSEITNIFYEAIAI